MGDLLTRKQVILAINETTYGTDPAMTGTNAILAYDIDMDVKGEKLERAVMRDTLTPLPHVIGMKEVVLNFKTEIVGSNAAPNIAPLLSGVGFDTGVVSGTARTYTFLDDNHYSVAFKVYKDSNVHKVLGCRGNVKFILEAGKYGVAEWAFQGLYDPVAAVSGTIDVSGLSANKPPILYNSLFQIAGFSPVTSKAEIDLGNEIVRRASLNASYGVAEFKLVGRKPSMSFDADAVVESSNPFFGDWSGAIVDTFSIDVGITAGNRAILSGIFEYDSNKYGDQDGVMTYECVASLVSSNTDTQRDELTLKYILA